MSDNAIALVEEYFADLEDPRADNAWHNLFDLLVIAILAVICGADSWVQVETYGQAKEAWLREFLELPHGIPTHHTFNRLFRRLDPDQFQASFFRWIQAIQEVTAGQVVAIDGKTLRRSHDRRLGKTALHLVSAWATSNQLLLGQRKVADKSNEIAAIPELIRILALEGCIVTIDAIGCQRAFAQQIVDQEADYVLALKENQGRLYEDVSSFFTYAAEKAFRHIESDYHKTVNKKHGRIEIRRCWVISDPEYIETLRDKKEWSSLRTIAKVEAERRIGEESSVTVRYYITSLGCNAGQVLRSVRAHWGIENSLHWILDIAFREDESRVRKGNGAQNLALLRRLALTLLKREKTVKWGVSTKRFNAACDNAYLLKVLAGSEA
jgi:predicted transposase YbfD/YdcC